MAKRKAKKRSSKKESKCAPWCGIILLVLGIWLVFNPRDLGVVVGILLAVFGIQKLAKK